MTEVKDFTRKRERALFRIDDDVFEAAPALPAETLIEFSGRFSDLEQSLSPETLHEVLSLVLLPESFERLSSRLRDKKNPVDIDQFSDIVVWLLERYGKRPTRPASNSPAGPPVPEPGTNLTGDPSGRALTSPPSPMTVS